MKKILYLLFWFIAIKVILPLNILQSAIAAFSFWLTFHLIIPFIFNFISKHTKQKYINLSQEKQADKYINKKDRFYNTGFYPYYFGDRPHNNNNNNNK